MTYFLMICTVFLFCAGPVGIIAAILLWGLYVIELDAQKTKQIKKENERLKKYENDKHRIEYLQLKENEEYLRKHGKM